MTARGYRSGRRSACVAGAGDGRFDTRCCRSGRRSTCVTGAGDGRLNA